MKTVYSSVVNWWICWIFRIYHSKKSYLFKFSTLFNWKFSAMIFHSHASNEISHAMFSHPLPSERIRQHSRQYLMFCREFVVGARQNSPHGNCVVVFFRLGLGWNVSNPAGWVNTYSQFWLETCFFPILFWIVIQHFMRHLDKLIVDYFFGRCYHFTIFTNWTTLTWNR